MLLPTVRCLQFQDLQPRDVDHNMFSCFLELLVACGRTMAPRSLRLGSVFYECECVELVHGERVVHALHVHDLLILLNSI